MRKKEEEEDTSETAYYHTLPHVKLTHGRSWADVLDHIPRKSDPEETGTEIKMMRKPDPEISY